MISLQVHDKAKSSEIFLSFQARKSGSSHLFGVGPGEADKTALVQELSKAITFFVLGPTLMKFHIQTRLIESFPMTFRTWQCADEKFRFTPLHTLHQLKRDEALFPPLQRVVEIQARYRQIPGRGFWG